MQIPSLERKLGKDAWEIYEQVCIACLDVNDVQVADVFLNQLEKRFPNSIRVGELALHGKSISISISISIVVISMIAIIMIAKSCSVRTCVRIRAQASSLE